MTISTRVLELVQSAGLILVIAAGTACTANTADSEALDQATSDLKGGVPANAHGKGKNKGEAGAAGSVAGGDEDAGVAGGPGKDKKPKKDKATKPAKPTKQRGNSAGASAGDADGDVDESGDESADEDQAADESADSDQGVDETV